MVHGPLGDEQPPGDLPVGQALGQQRQHLLLARGQPGRRGPGGRARPARDRPASRVPSSAAWPPRRRPWRPGSSSMARACPEIGLVRRAQPGQGSVVRQAEPLPGRRPRRASPRPVSRANGSGSPAGGPTGCLQPAPARWRATRVPRVDVPEARSLGRPDFLGGQVGLARQPSQLRPRGPDRRLIHAARQFPRPARSPRPAAPRPRLAAAAAGWCPGPAAGSAGSPGRCRAGRASAG